MSLKPGLAKHLKELEQKVCILRTQSRGPLIHSLLFAYIEANDLV